jgi:hypothetical protein
VNAAFSKEGARALRLAWILLAVAVAAGAAVAWGSLEYLKKEKRDDVASQRQLGEARAKVETAKRERDDLRNSSAVFADLVSRGILKEESRLDLIERLDALKAKHRLIDLEYEIQPQRPLPLMGGRVFNAVDVLGSRVRIKAQALHEGEALAFIEELVHPPTGFNPASRCTLARMIPGSPDAVTPRVEATCTLEWISLRDKRGNRAS